MTSRESRPHTSFWTTLPGLLTAIAAVITAIGGLLGVLYGAGIIGPTKTTEEPLGIPNGSNANVQGSSWIVRLSNVDDHGYAFLNGKKVLECHVKVDKLCEADISDMLRPGPNSLRVEFVNTEWGWAYHYQILKDGLIWSEDRCGRVGHQGCQNDDKTLGTVFEKTFEITP